MSVLVKIKAIEPRFIPKRMTPQAACYDACAAESGSMSPGEHRKISLGFAMELPEGFEATIRPRSGLAANHGVVGVLGTIDADFRGTVHAILVNHGARDFAWMKGDRLCQLSIRRATEVDFEAVEELGDTERGSGGFGSTGV